MYVVDGIRVRAKRKVCEHSLKERGEVGGGEGEGPFQLPSVLSFHWQEPLENKGEGGGQGPFTPNTPVQPKCLLKS